MEVGDCKHTYLGIKFASDGSWDSQVLLDKDISRKEVIWYFNLHVP